LKTIIGAKPRFFALRQKGGDENAHFRGGEWGNAILQAKKQPFLRHINGRFLCFTRIALPFAPKKISR
jgi:hypothetical protein